LLNYIESPLTRVFEIAVSRQTAHHICAVGLVLLTSFTARIIDGAELDIGGRCAVHLGAGGRSYCL
jgi:hypothetical protein